jgi:hypothetical protein
MIDPIELPDLSRFYARNLSRHLSGCYYIATPAGAASTANTLGNGTGRFSPFPVPAAITLAKIGVEVTAVGEAGSVIRLGIYGDNGSGFPGPLVLDAGTVPGDAVAAAAELTINQALQPGLYWVGGVVQGAPTTQPTLRTLTAIDQSIPLPISGGTTPGANHPTQVGFVGFGMAGAFPANWPTPAPNLTAQVARVFVKIA